MKSGWWLWAIRFHKGYRNRPQSSRCDVTVLYFCFPSLSAFLRAVQLLVWRTNYVPFYMLVSRLLATVSLASAFVLALSRPGRSLFRSESVIVLVDNLYTEAI
jgi:hypothetical protein